MSKTISQLRTSAFDEIANSMNTAAKEAGFENPRITFIYGVGTENLATEEDTEYYQVHVTAQVTEGYTESNHKFFAVTGTTYCYDRFDVICTLAGGLDDLTVNTKDDAYDYANHDHEPVIDALAEVIGYFYDDAQLPYHWHRVFETA